MVIDDWRGPVWACGFAGNLAAFPLLPGIASLVVAIDHDEGGRKAAVQAITRWHKAGRKTFVRQHVHPGKDLNDLVKDDAG